jgi:hypothetical protein
VIEVKPRILRKRPLSKSELNIIFGLLLGGGELEIKDNARFKFSNELLIHIIKDKIKRIVNNVNIKNIIVTCYHQDLNKMYKEFYLNGKKTISNNLDFMMNEESLAYWFLSGAKINDQQIRFDTSKYSLDENKKLQSYLLRCFDLRSKIVERMYKTKKYYGLYLNKKNSIKLYNIIEKYLVLHTLESSTTTCQTFKKNDDIV